MARASLVTSSVSSGSSATATLRPWRSAFCLTRALPAAVRGPVLRRALRRFAARLRSVVTPCDDAAGRAREVAGRDGGLDDGGHGELATIGRMGGALALAYQNHRPIHIRVKERRSVRRNLGPRCGGAGDRCLSDDYRL